MLDETKAPAADVYQLSFSSQFDTPGTFTPDRPSLTITRTADIVSFRRMELGSINQFRLLCVFRAPFQFDLIEQITSVPPINEVNTIFAARLAPAHVTAMTLLSDLGVRLFVQSEPELGEIIRLLTTAPRTATIISEALFRSLVTGLWTRPTGPAQADLTPREAEVLHFVIRGHGTKSIANRIGISVRTVDAHRRNISRKIGPLNALKQLAGHPDVATGRPEG